jgi:hypothetical protein
VEGRLKHHRHEKREKRHSKKKRQVSECEGDGTQAASEKKVNVCGYFVLLTMQ